MPWAFTVFEEKFREQEMTFAEAEKAEELMSYVDVKGVAVRPTWGELNPVRSARAAIAIATVMYSTRTGTSVDEVRSKIRELPIIEFIDSVDLNDQDDLPTVMVNGFPPEADEPSTTS
jgi:hypothetical protein